MHIKCRRILKFASFANIAICTKQTIAHCVKIIIMIILSCSDSGHVKYGSGVISGQMKWFVYFWDVFHNKQFYNSGEVLSDQIYNSGKVLSDQFHNLRGFQQISSSFPKSSRIYVYFTISLNTAFAIIVCFVVCSIYQLASVGRTPPSCDSKHRDAWLFVTIFTAL